MAAFDGRQDALRLVGEPPDHGPKRVEEPVQGQARREHADARDGVMSNEIVKFSNQFNNVALKKFDAVHLDVLMAIASRLF